jgi:hypothetical protein
VPRRRIPRPRASPHRFSLDPTVAPDWSGQLTCRCGNVATASCHRIAAQIPRPTLDIPALAAGERDDDNEEPDHD